MMLLAVRKLDLAAILFLLIFLAFPVLLLATTSSTVATTPMATKETAIKNAELQSAVMLPSGPFSLGQADALIAGLMDRVDWIYHYGSEAGDLSQNPKWAPVGIEEDTALMGWRLVPEDSLLSSTSEEESSLLHRLLQHGCDINLHRRIFKGNMPSEDGFIGVWFLCKFAKG